MMTTIPETKESLFSYIEMTQEFKLKAHVTKGDYGYCDCFFELHIIGSPWESKYHCFFLNSISTAPIHRKKGLAVRTLAKLEEIAALNGIHFIYGHFGTRDMEDWDYLRKEFYPNRNYTVIPNEARETYSVFKRLSHQFSEAQIIEFILVSRNLHRLSNRSIKVTDDLKS